MKEAMIALNSDKIKQLLPGTIDLTICTSLPSTNDYLMQHFAANKICLAEQQTAGRGRLGHRWYSPFATNIYLSYAVRIAKPAHALAGLSLSMSLAVLNTLKLFGIAATVKWPNDVMVADKKLAGNLLDIHATTSHHCDVIIGIGLNVNMLQVPLSQSIPPWTSMRKILRRGLDRNPIVASLIQQVQQALSLFTAQGFEGFLPAWQVADSLLHQLITLTCGSQQFTGIMQGVDTQGRLRLQTAPGQQQAFSAGEVTLK